MLRISAGIGFIPLAGDIALAVFKANSRNCKLVEEYLRVLGEEHIAAGLPNLTPEPPALPGGRQTGEEFTSHPAQPATKKMVKDHSASQINSTAANPASQIATGGQTATIGEAAKTPATQSQVQEKKKWWKTK